MSTEAGGGDAATSQGTPEPTGAGGGRRTLRGAGGGQGGPLPTSGAGRECVSGVLNCPACGSFYRSILGLGGFARLHTPLSYHVCAIL